MTSPRIALVFPGQGAEEPEMGLALASRDSRSRGLLALASEATGVDLARAIERGEQVLSQTEVLQPALVAVALGAAYALESQGASFAAVLGHSLGELTAACFAFGVDDETTIALATERGRLMARAAARSPGGMVALASIEDPVPEGLSFAAHNAADEFVLAGDASAIDRMLARRVGATRLRVAGPWHSPAMAPAVEPLRALLDRAFANRTLRVPLISTVTAAVAESSSVSDLLARGLVAPVRWVETLRALATLDITTFALSPPARLSRALCRRTLGARADLRFVDTMLTSVSSERCG